MKVCHGFNLVLHSALLHLHTVTVWGWEIRTGYGFGDTPTSSPNASDSFRKAIKNTVSYDSVPFQIDSQSFSFQVNWTQMGISGADVDVKDPMSVYYQYALAWKGGEELNATLRAAEDLSDNEQPRLCVNLPLGLFEASVTNGYDQESPGNCEPALGRRCVEAIMEMGGSGVSDCRPLLLPDECTSKFPSGGIASASILSWNATNSSESSPLGFAFHNKIISHEPGSDPTAYNSIAEQLHMVIFESRYGYHPVCLRNRDTHVSKSDPSTADAGRNFSDGISKALYAVAALLAVAFFVP